MYLGWNARPEQALLVAPVDRIGQLEEELLVGRLGLVGERPDLRLVLLDHEEQIRAVVRIGQRDGPVEPQVGEGQPGRQGRELAALGHLVGLASGLSRCRRGLEPRDREKHQTDETKGYGLATHPLIV